MKKIIFLLVFAIAFLQLASAVPQVIFSSINLTIEANETSIKYRVTGEGIDASEIITLSNTTNYSRTNMPVTFSRDICESSDTAVLIKALANTNNITGLWIDCVNNLSTCRTGRVDGENFTALSNQYIACNTQLVQKDSAINTANSEVKDLKSQRMIIGAAAVFAGIAAYYFWRRATPKTISSPGLSQLPRGQRV